MQYQSYSNGQIDFYVSADDLGAMMAQATPGEISFTGLNKAVLNEKIKQLQVFYQQNSVTLKLCYYGAKLTYSLVSDKPISPYTQKQFAQYFEKELVPFIKNKIQSWYYDERTNSWKL